MIKELRKKFVVVAMSSTFAVLTSIILIINMTNYKRVEERADDMIHMLVENREMFQSPLESTEEINRNTHHGPENFTPETPFETRFFTVTLDDDGEILETDLGKIAAITENNATQYAKKIFKGHSDKGFCSIYRYNVLTNDDDIMIVFLDCRQNLESLKTFGVVSIGVSALGLLAVFLLVLVFSKIVFKPVEESYNKQKIFITDASHEIKTPLTIIEANTELIEMENGKNQWTKSTRNQISRLSRLTNQLVTLAKLDESADEKIKSEIDLTNVIRKTVENFQPSARLQNKRINIDIESNICIKADEKAMIQLMDILMDNAIKYSPQNTDINVRLRRKNKKVQIDFSNYAENIYAGNLDIIFERFYRMDTSRNSETGGSGIGLSVAKSIVQAHKGKISAVSYDGKILTIIIQL